jgi:dihydropteroate synthase
MPQCTINGILIGDPAPARIMGVINCSPESFFKGSFREGGDILETAHKMVKDGADIIDLGGRSTAPLAPKVSTEQEKERMLCALAELEGSGITISVDTMHPDVLERCLRYDVHAINDINGLANPEYARLVADSGLAAVLMASRTVPGDSTTIKETFLALEKVVSRCREYGIDEFVLDPAIGLWTPERNVAFDWELCSNFAAFSSFKRPLLAAVSRKTFIGDLLNHSDPEGRLAGSIAVTTHLLEAGADIIRTHDVRETADTIKVFEKMERVNA